MQQQQLPNQHAVHVNHGVQCQCGVEAHPKDPARFPKETAGRRLFWISIALLLLGLMALICEAASIGLVKHIYASKALQYDKDLVGWKMSHPSVLYRPSFDAYHYRPVTLSGAGVWAGAFVIVTACLGIAAGRSKQNRCLIITSMVLSIVSSLMAVGIMTSAGINLSRMEDCNYYTTVGGNFAFVCGDHRWKIFLGLQIVLILYGIVTSICCVIMATFCCQTVLTRHYQIPTQYGMMNQSQPVGAPGYGPNVMGQSQTGVPMYGQAAYPHRVLAGSYPHQPELQQPQAAHPITAEAGQPSWQPALAAQPTTTGTTAEFKYVNDEPPTYDSVKSVK